MFLYPEKAKNKEKANLDWNHTIIFMYAGNDHFYVALIV